MAESKGTVSVGDQEAVVKSYFEKRFAKDAAPKDFLPFFGKGSYAVDHDGTRYDEEKLEEFYKITLKRPSPGWVDEPKCVQTGKFEVKFTVLKVMKFKVTFNFVKESKVFESMIIEKRGLFD